MMLISKEQQWWSGGFFLPINEPTPIPDEVAPTFLALAGVVACEVTAACPVAPAPATTSPVNMLTEPPVAGDEEPHQTAN